MSDLSTFDTAEYIENKKLKQLIRKWKSCSDAGEKESLKRKIFDIIYDLEREVFFARYELKDFTTQLPPKQIYTALPEATGEFHSAEYYKPALLHVLKDNGRELPVAEAVEKVFQKVKEELLPGDFIRSKNNVYRYITNIHFAASQLKKEGLLRKDERVSHKYWALHLNIPNEITYAIVNTQGIAALGIESETPAPAETHINLLICDPTQPENCHEEEVYLTRSVETKVQKSIFEKKDLTKLAIELYDLPNPLQDAAEEFWLSHKENFIRGFSRHDEKYAYMSSSMEIARRKYHLE